MTKLLADMSNEGEAPESEAINLSAFLNQWLSVVDPADEAVCQEMDLFSFCEKEMNEPLSLIQELDAGCRPETLGMPKDIEAVLASVPNSSDLLTLQLQKVELEKRQKDPWYRYKLLDKMKYRSRDTPWKHFAYRKMQEEGNVDMKQVICKPDVIVTAQVYRSYLKKKHLILEREFEMLGCQQLTELRDAIHCITDYVCIGDYSTNPDLSRDITAKDVYKSGLFFIEGVFYNDMRHPDCRDYSRTIREWAQDPSRGFGSLTTERMETTRIIDLTIRLGQPYLYLHQGNCEHLLIFSDVRMLHPEDCHLLDKYPLQTYRSRERKSKCRACMTYMAKWVVLGCSLSPEDPSLFCETCFRSLHCDNNGKMLLTNLKVFPLPAV